MINNDNEPSDVPDENGDYVEIVHNTCGLPVGLCVCPNAQFKWDEESGNFIDTGILED